MSPTTVIRIHFAHESKTAQYTSEGCLRWGLKGFKSHIKEQVNIFAIEGPRYLLEKGPSKNELPQINKLGLHPTSVFPYATNLNESCQQPGFLGHLL